MTDHAPARSLIEAMDRAEWWLSSLRPGEPAPDPAAMIEMLRGAVHAADENDMRRMHNQLRILMSIDRHELEAVGIIAAGDHNAWGTFVRDPFRWVIRADDVTVAKVWTIIKRRGG